jgi:hypothetical protein
LHAIATAEEKYFRDHGTYTQDVATLRRYPDCTIQPGVEVTVHDASAHGWAASGTHAGFPARSCVQWYAKPGQIPVPVTRRDRRRADEVPGGVVCDSPEK